MKFMKFFMEISHSAFMEEKKLTLTVMLVRREETTTG